MHSSLPFFSIRRGPRIGALGVAAVLVGAALALPLVSLLASLFGGASDAWAHLVATALPRYAGNTLLLVLLVGCGVVSMGVVSAWLVTAYRFPGRGFL